MRGRVTWAHYPHRLRLPFYVYQYTTGLAGAPAAYLALLRAGDHGYPLDLLRAAGVDLAAPEPMHTPSPRCPPRSIAWKGWLGDAHLETVG